jgi:hypothetical protein
MNKINELFNNISDEEIRQGIMEIKKDEGTGLICNGIVRKYSKIVGDMTGNNGTVLLMLTEINILRQGAYRWVNH